MDNELYIDLTLRSLSSNFSHFVMNFNMHKMEVTMPELYNMLNKHRRTFLKLLSLQWLWMLIKKKGSRRAKGKENPETQEGYPKEEWG